MSGIQSWQFFCATSMDKNPIWHLGKLQVVVRSATFVFKAECTCIQKNEVFHFQTRAQRHELCQSAAAPRRRARDAAPAPRRPRHAQPETPIIEAAASLGTRAPTCLLVSPVRGAHTRAPSYVHRSRRRRSTTASSSSARRHPRAPT
jgi:hypothetical protein